MAGRRPLSLDRRQGVYYFRAGFPSDLHGLVGRAELRLSLQTRLRADAHRATFTGRLAFARLCARLRAMKSAPPSPPQIRAMIEAFGKALLDGVEAPPVFKGTEQAEDRDYALHMASEAIIDLNAAIADDVLEGGAQDRQKAAESLIIPAARKLSAENQIDFNALPEAERKLILQGVARALVEERKKLIYRAADFLTPYEPEYPLFKKSAPPVPSTTFGAAVEKYIVTKSDSWVPRTKAEIRRILRLATEHFGADKALSAITKDDVRAMRDQIQAWRKKPAPLATLKDLGPAPADKRIGSRTAKKYMGFVVGAFAFWVDEGFLDVSPVGGITISVSKADKAGKRRPFSAGELKQLFSSPLFVGCLNRAKRHKPGSDIFRDGYYWIPLIGALSGMRITEIVQLATADVDADGDGPVFRVRGDAALNQSLKTSSSWRTIPIHKRLVELGLLDYVAMRAKDAGDHRLFVDVPVAGTGGAGGEFSKWFGRYLKRIDLKKTGVVFHSFRHAFTDALREVSAPGYVVKDLLGHSSSDVTSSYGTKTTMAAARHWVNKLTLLDDLPPLPNASSDG